MAQEHDAANAQRKTHNPHAINHEDENAYTSELDDMPVMMAIHGGAYFFGSINTHRYVYWRLVRRSFPSSLPNDYL